MKFQINPSAQMWIMAVVALLYIGAQNSVSLPLGIPEWVGPYIHSWSNFIIQIYLVLAPILLPGFSSSLPGPLAPPDPPVVKAAMAEAAKTAAKVVAFLALGLFGLALLDSGTTMARADAPIRLALGNGHAAASSDGPVTNGPAAKADDSIFSRIASLVQQDFAHAAADAIAEPTVQDGNGYACWTAWQPLGNIIKRHPAVLTGQIADDIEGTRLVLAAFQKVCQVQACQTVAADEASIAVKIVTALPISINPPAPINIFAKTCNDIPNISLVAPPVGAAAPASTGN